MGAGAAQLSPHWSTILQVFETLLDTLRRNNVPAFLVRKLFQQLFSFVNVQLFNQLLLRRECCSFSNGEYVKTGLAEVEQWIHAAGSHWVGESWEQLKYIRQARSPSALLLTTLLCCPLMASVQAMSRRREAGQALWLGTWRRRPSARVACIEFAFPRDQAWACQARQQGPSLACS